MKKIPKPSRKQKLITLKPGDIANACDDRDTRIREELISGFQAPNVDQASRSFMAGLAVYSLIDLEKMIIRLEHFLSKNPPNPTTNSERIEGYKKAHLETYNRLQETLGANFEAFYKDMLKSTNECARANLDMNDGRTYSYIIPKFNPDGTHEPWGERDVPWNTKD